MDDAPLFDRLGARDGITAVVEKAVANHYDNPLVAPRYAHATKDRATLTANAIEFFCTGLTGVPTYEGRSLTEAHAGMNVNEQEFVAVLDDIIDAMTSCGVGQREQHEVIAILYDMKSEIVHL